MKHLLIFTLATLAPLSATAKDPASELGKNMAFSQMRGMAGRIANDPQGFLADEAKNDQEMQRRLKLIGQALDNDEAKVKAMAEINDKAKALGKDPVFSRDDVAAKQYDLKKNRESLKEIADYTSYRMGLAKSLVEELTKARNGGNLDSKTNFDNNDNYELEHQLGVLNWTHAYDKRVVKNKFTMYYLEPVMGLLTPMNKKFPVGTTTAIPKGEGLIDDIALAGDCSKVKVPADDEFLAEFNRNFGTKDGLKFVCEKGRKSFAANRDGGEAEVKIGYNGLHWPFRHAPDPKSMVQELRKISRPAESEELAVAPAEAAPAEAITLPQPAVRVETAPVNSVDGTLPQ